MLDLYAGSGSFSIEAVSRGAESAVAVERSSRPGATAKANIALTGFDSNIELVRADVAAYVRRTVDETSFDIVFADPPFAKADDKCPSFRKLRGLLGDITAPDGLFVIRIFEQVEVPQVAAMKLTKDKKIGISRLLFYQHEGQREGNTS
ncbi:MAG: RsmD family RNA methyltransferase [Planctomycetota bacterium]|nr:RsmD family RNA methyltransferase [Planctomycetota bacterium]